MKKILYVTTVSSTINGFFIPHIEMLIKNKGYKVDIACSFNKEVSKKLVDLGVKISEISFSRDPLTIRNIKAIEQIKKLVEKEKYDIVHVHTPVAAFVTRFALRNFKDIKIIYTAHGYHFYKGAPLLNWGVYYPLEKIAAKWTDRLITINNEDFERAQKFKLRNEGQAFLMNGVGVNPSDYEVEKDFDRKKFREDLGINENDFVILILAELNKNKNHIQIIKALEKVKNRDNIKVICAGRGILKEKLESEIKNRNLEKNIKLLGFRSDVKELIEISDCVALFSKREGLPKCLMEGMLKEKLLIGTNNRGIRTLIDQEWLANFNDIEGTTKLLEKICSLNNKQLEDIKKNMKKKSKKYQVNIILESLNKFYEFENI